MNARVARFKGFFRTIFFAPVVTTLVAVAVVFATSTTRVSAC